MGKTYCVYIHTFPNGKVYIGKTNNIITRWANGRGYKNHIIMNEAINTYGWENIQHDILYDDLTEKEALIKEEQEIRKRKSFKKEYGYNCQCGNVTYRVGGTKERKTYKHEEGKKCTIYVNNEVYDEISKLSKKYGTTEEKIIPLLLVEKVKNIKILEMEDEVFRGK